MRQTRSSTLSWKRCLVIATGTSSWRFLGGKSVCAMACNTAFHLIYSYASVRWHNKPDKGIILLSRRPFDSASVQEMLATSPSSELEFQNDVYAKACRTLECSMLVCVTVLQLIAGSLAVLKHRHTPARHNYNRHHLPCHRKAYQ